MSLNTAGINAILAAAIGSGDVQIYAAIGNGTTSADQTSNERHLLTFSAAGGVLTASGVPLAYTGTAGAGATNALFYSASTAGTFYGSKALTGDQTFNASGDYNLTSLTLTGSSS